MAALLLRLLPPRSENSLSISALLYSWTRHVRAEKHEAVQVARFVYPVLTSCLGIALTEIIGTLRCHFV